MHVSERRACAALGQHRSTQRKAPRGRDDEETFWTLARISSFMLIRALRVWAYEADMATRFSALVQRM